jgi:dihydroorotase
MRIGYSLFLCVAVAASAQQYDVILHGGTVVDAKNNLNAKRDVAIAGGKIAAVAAAIPAASGKKNIDVTGLYVAPGLIDLHVHVFSGDGPEYTGVNSVSPDDHSFRSGVTTMVDAGSSGWKSFPEFKRRTIDRSKTRVLALLNIVGAGMGGNNSTEQNTADMDAKATADRIQQNRAHIVGVKTAHYQAPNWIAVERALDAATRAGVPLMVDFGKFQNERPFEELVTKRLRPGDIYTHTYLPWVPLLDPAGKVRDFMFQARKRGVIFDVGHGGGSFVFRHAIPAIKQGFPPDSISTDLHIASMNGAMKDMTNVMSKFVNMGMSVEQVIAAGTWHPARQIKREQLGNLSVGAVADVSVLRLETGQFGFIDVYGARLRGTKRLAAELTLKDGKVMWDRNGLAREDWDKLGIYEMQGDPVWDGSTTTPAAAGKK